MTHFMMKNSYSVEDAFSKARFALQVQQQVQTHIEQDFYWLKPRRQVDILLHHGTSCVLPPVKIPAIINWCRGGDKGRAGVSGKSGH